MEFRPEFDFAAVREIIKKFRSPPDTVQGRLVLGQEVLWFLGCTLKWAEGFASKPEYETAVAIQTVESQRTPLNGSTEALLCDLEEIASPDTVYTQSTMLTYVVRFVIPILVELFQRLLKDE